MKYFLFGILITLCLFTLLPNFVFAAPNKGQSVQLTNPIGGSIKENNKEGTVKIPEIIGYGIKVALGIIGSIAFAAFVYGGFLWLTSAGHADKVTTGTNTMLYATIGLFIIFSAYAILNTIISGIAK